MVFTENWNHRTTISRHILYKLKYTNPIYYLPEGNIDLRNIKFKIFALTSLYKEFIKANLLCNIL